MKLAAAVACVVAGCVDSGKTAEMEERIAKLDDRISRAERSITELTELAQGGRGPLARPDNRGHVGTWWCATSCARTRDECRKLLESDRHMNDPGRPDCDARRVAYCDASGRRCLRTRSECQAWWGADTFCLGVE